MDEVATMSKVIKETKRVVGNIEPSQLDNPSPCEAWTVRDVLNHITGGAEMFGLCVRDGDVPDSKLGELMTGDNLGTDYKASFNKAVDDAEASFQIPGAMDRIVKLPFGEMPAGMALNIAIFDVTTHAWDLAKATGQSTDLDPEVLATAYQIAQGMLSDEMRASGIFGPEVSVPEDAPMASRLAGLAGRTP
ncbi:MAG: TIGR03086 family metal-binding protein [Acidimicrobiia bacterium]